MDSAVAEATAALGGLDVLIHAAGIAPGGPAEDIEAGLWEKVMAVNATGTFLTNQAVFPHLKQRGGRIINFASVAGVQGYPNKAAYAASKGAVLAWVRSIAVELASTASRSTPSPLPSGPLYDKTRASMTPKAP